MQRRRRRFLVLAAVLAALLPAGAARAEPARDYILVVDQRDTNVPGGACTPGQWNTRVLNQVKSDVMGHAALSANRITLPAGTYEAVVRAPAVSVDRHRIRLRNVTLGETVLLGSAAYSDMASFVQTDSVATGRFVLEAEAELEVQHHCGSNPGSFAFGADPNDGEDAIYTTVQLYRLPPLSAGLPEWMPLILGVLVLGGGAWLLRGRPAALRSRAALGALVLALSAGGGAGCASQGIPTPLQLSLAGKAQVFPEDVAVRGLRVDLLYGIQKDVAGLDLGVANDAGRLRGAGFGLANVAREDAAGVQVGLVNAAQEAGLAGAQLGFANLIEGRLRGAQLGFANSSGTGAGFQLGFVNSTTSMKGLQIGLLNLNEEGWLPFFPLFNFGF